jgi:hypothetical protein
MDMNSFRRVFLLLALAGFIASCGEKVTEKVIYKDRDAEASEQSGVYDRGEDGEGEEGDGKLQTADGLIIETSGMGARLPESPLLMFEGVWRSRCYSGVDTMATPLRRPGCSIYGQIMGSFEISYIFRDSSILLQINTFEDKACRGSSFPAFNRQGYFAVNRPLPDTAGGIELTITWKQCVGSPNRGLTFCYNEGQSFNGQQRISSNAVARILAAGNASAERQLQWFNQFDCRGQYEFWCSNDGFMFDSRIGTATSGAGSFFDYTGN